MGRVVQLTGDRFVIQKAQYTLVAVVPYDELQHHSMILADICLAIWLVRQYSCVSQSRGLWWIVN
jgi:hypothetical protein